MNSGAKNRRYQDIQTCPCEEMPAKCMNFASVFSPLAILSPTMSTLQIRQMPDSVYAQLTQRAAQFHRSLTQQAIFDLSQASSPDAGAQRRAVLRKLRASHASPLAMPSIDPSALASWLREDRER
jgi:plasmid stability protein